MSCGRGPWQAAPVRCRHTKKATTIADGSWSFTDLSVSPGGRSLAASNWQVKLSPWRARRFRIAIPAFYRLVVFDGSKRQTTSHSAR